MKPASQAGDEGMGRTLAIFTLKVLHTFVYFFESLCVCAVIYGAMRNRIHKWTVAAIVVIVLEGTVLFFNKMQCPMRIWAERLGAARGSVTDLFLPRWLADRIFQIYTPLFVIGCLGIVWRKLRWSPMPQF